jgi:adenine-specific DNA glycosylase
VCLTCPVVELCATRGELAAVAKPVPQKKREIDYLLTYRNGNSADAAVLLVQRAQDASLMPGMWELPEVAGVNGAVISLFRLRHSITGTDYSVRVWRGAPPLDATGKWIPAEGLRLVALTGLARKILRKAELLQGNSRPTGN